MLTYVEAYRNVCEIGIYIYMVCGFIWFVRMCVFVQTIFPYRRESEQFTYIVRSGVFHVTFTSKPTTLQYDIYSYSVVEVYVALLLDSATSLLSRQSVTTHSSFAATAEPSGFRLVFRWCSGLFRHSTTPSSCRV